MVDQMQLNVEEGIHDNLKKYYEIWGDKCAKEIVVDALEQKCVKVAETYLQLKPWLYGTVTSSFIIMTCIEIAIKKQGFEAQLEVLSNMDHCYVENIKTRFLTSDDNFEVQLLGAVLNKWHSLTEPEGLAMALVGAINKDANDLLTLPPLTWNELAQCAGNCESHVIASPIRVGSFSHCSAEVIRLITVDLFVRTADAGLLLEISGEVLWKYLLLQQDLTAIKKWIFHQYGSALDQTDPLSEVDDAVCHDTCVIGPVTEHFLEIKKNVPISSDGLLNQKMYEGFELNTSEGITKVINLVEEDPFLGGGEAWESITFPPITQEMVDLIDVVCDSISTEPNLTDFILLDLFSDYVLNELAKVQVFSTQEKLNVCRLVRRILVSGKLKVTAATGHILSEDVSNALKYFFAENSVMGPTLEFLECFPQNISEISGNQDWFSLCIAFHDFSHCQSHKNVFQLSVQSLAYLSRQGANREKLLLPSLLTMILSPSESMSDFTSLEYPNYQSITGAVGTLCKVLHAHQLTPLKVVEELIPRYPYLERLLVRKWSVTSPLLDVSVYDLLEANIPYDVSRLFQWQSENRFGSHDKSSLPNFSDERLSKSYGAHHTLDFIYYLRTARPSYACADILISLVTNKSKLKMASVQSAVYSLALNSWPDKAITAACVSLLLMVGLDCDMIRIVFALAGQILDGKGCDSCHVRSEVRQSQDSELMSCIKKKLSQLCQREARQKTAAELLILHEEMILEKFSQFSSLDKKYEKQVYDEDIECVFKNTETGLKYTGTMGKESKFNSPNVDVNIRVLFEWTLVAVQFALLHHLPWPQQSLKLLACHDLWFEFFVLAQAFGYSKEVILKTASEFRCVALREHIRLALDHLLYYREYESKCTTKSATRSARGFLYSKIGIQAKREHSPAGQDQDDMDEITDELKNEETINDIETGSVIDDRLSYTTADSEFEGSLERWHSLSSVDIYSVLLLCHQRENPTRELLLAAVALNTPVFSVYATCYKNHDPVLCLSIWLYTNLSESSQQNVFLPLLMIRPSDEGDRSTEPDETMCDWLVMQSGLDELLALLLSHVSEGSFLEAIEGMEIFDPVSPLISLLKGIQEVGQMCRSNEIHRLLQQCCDAMVNDNFSEKLTSCIGNLEWLAEACMSLVCTAIDDYLINSHAKLQLLSSLSSYGQMCPFSYYHVNWQLVTQICKILDSVDVTVKFHDMLFSFASGKTKDTVDEFVSVLNAGGYFVAALQIAQLCQLPLFSVVCAQFRNDFDAEEMALCMSVSRLQEFMACYHKKLEASEVPANVAVSCFQSLSKKVTKYAFKFTCLKFAVFWAYGKKDNFHVVDTGNNAGQSGDDTEISLMREKLEYELWQAYTQSVRQKEDESATLDVKPPEWENSWPWERSSGTSWLDYGVVETASQLVMRSAKVMAGHQPTVVASSLLQSQMNLPTEDVKETSAWVLDTSFGSEESGESKGNDKIPMERLSELDNMNGVIQVLADKCLDSGLIVSACRILSFFGEINQNVNNLLMMLKTAEGTEKQNKLMNYDYVSSGLDTSRKNARKRTVSVGSLGCYFCEDDELIDTSLHTLMTMLHGLKHGKKMGERIIALYRLSCDLNCSFKSLIHNENPKELLCHVFQHKFGIQIARDLITCLPIENETVLTFLCDQVVSSILTTAGLSISSNPVPAVLSWNDMALNWKQLVTLCADATAVGNELVNRGQMICTEYSDLVEKVNLVTVELVVHAHDCFVVGANMEGISTVLRTSHSLTSSLLEHSQWSLMVRLLTGVGRYSEMSYIIDALREHEQFEPLLGRGRDLRSREKGLDQALVHYLRSNYPHDTDTLRLVALHFSLYAEVAEMWASEGDRIINCILECQLDLGSGPSRASVALTPGKSGTSARSLTPVKSTPRKLSNTKVSSHLTPNSGSLSPGIGDTEEPDHLRSTDVKLLTQAMHSYAHAAEYYMQDQQLTTAVEMSQQAQLLALQIALTNKAIDCHTPVLRLLRLTSHGVAQVTSKYLRVIETQIVSRAYNYTVDWAAGIYQQFICQGKEEYLTEYLATFHLTPEVVLDVVKKLEFDGLTRERTDKMCTLLTHITEGDIVYRVASQLGLKEVLDAVLTSPAAPYLKDTVFTRGFTE